MSDAATTWTVLAAVAVLVVLGLTLLQVRRSPAGRPQPDDAPEPFAAEPEDRPLAAVVMNPTKVADQGPVRSTVAGICAELGWAEPLWLETTPQDPGSGQAREALDRGADVVIAFGGDGTVRSVAETMAGTGTAMALLPAGTGNLLARNLAVDLTDVAASVRAALSGDDRHLDVGWVTVATTDALDGDPASGGDPTPAGGPDGGTAGATAANPDSAGATALVERPERIFLVMAGMGFDAAMMAGTPEALKARVGPLAYVVSGLRLLRGRQARVTLTVDDAVPLHRRVSTVVVGNVGTLLGGLTLMPDAEVDDGWLDGVTLAPRGIVGWAGVAVRVLTRRRKGHHRVEHWRGRRIVLTAERPEEAQLDGDPIGRAVTLRMRVDPGALLLRVPPPTPRRV